MYINFYFYDFLDHYCITWFLFGLWQILIAHIRILHSPSQNAFNKIMTKLTNLCGGGGGGVMTTFSFGDLGNYVKGFTCSPHEI